MKNKLYYIYLCIFGISFSAIHFLICFIFKNSFYTTFAISLVWIFLFICFIFMKQLKNKTNNISNIKYLVTIHDIIDRRKNDEALTILLMRRFSDIVYSEKFSPLEKEIVISFMEPFIEDPKVFDMINYLAQNPNASPGVKKTAIDIIEDNEYYMKEKNEE